MTLLSLAFFFFWVALGICEALSSAASTLSYVVLVFMAGILQLSELTHSDVLSRLKKNGVLKNAANAPKMSEGVLAMYQYMLTNALHDGAWTREGALEFWRALLSEAARDG